MLDCPARRIIRLIRPGGSGDGAAASATRPQEIKVVSPNALTEVEGDVFIVPECCTALRYQQVFPADDFGSLPGGRGEIIRIAFRPDGGLDEPRTSVWSNSLIRLSTTSVGADSIGNTFAANIGEDEVVVFEGDVAHHTENISTPEGPKEFDYVIDLQTPYFYDSNVGNLLIDWTFDELTPSTVSDFFTADWGGTTMVLGVPSDIATDRNGGVVTEFTFVSEFVPGDFDLNGVLDANDIDLLSLAVRQSDNDLAFDLNDDALVDDTDRVVWVRGLKNTYFGDSNLDGEFNTADLVAVLASGEYEDNIAGNSGWATGDWDGDADATTNDLVLGLAGGGYEQGPRQVVQAVPEPSSIMLVTAATLLLFARGSEVPPGRRAAPSLVELAMDCPGLE